LSGEENSWQNYPLQSIANQTSGICAEAKYRQRRLRENKKIQRRNHCKPDEKYHENNNENKQPATTHNGFSLSISNDDHELCFFFFKKKKQKTLQKLPDY